MNDSAVLEELRLIAIQRVYFGHQSVGGNIVAGLRDLCAASGLGPGVRPNVVSFDGTPPPPGGVFAESLIGTNGRPLTKCNAYQRNIREWGTAPDIALMKFCYVDFTRETNVHSLFQSYRETIGSLQAEHPETKFVHVTVPLVARSVPWKRLAKTVLGRKDETALENLQRNEFNRLLLERYTAEPVFDLAKVESTLPDGRRNTFETAGRTGYELVRAYSLDNAHLNQLGRSRAARELVGTLAQVARRITP